MKKIRRILFICLIACTCNCLAKGELTFLGHKIKLQNYMELNRHCKLIRQDLPITAEEIDKFQKDMPNSDLMELCKEVDEYKIKLHLNSFMFVEFVKKAAQEYAYTNKARKLLVWQILKHFDYDTFLQFSDKQFIVFLAYDTYFNGVAYIPKLEDSFFCDVFYDTSTFPEPMTKFSDDYKGQKEVSVDLSKIENLPESNIESKTLCIISNKKKYVFKYSVNIDLVEFLNTLPQFKLGKNYISDFGISNVTKSVILKQINSHIKKMDTIQGLNFILDICQQIKYSDDRTLWKRERFFFPEQSLYYLNIDCDDKSILFSYLVKQIYNLETVGILYPDKKHINVGLRYAGNERYKSIVYKGTKYIICEPTGDDFKIGQVGDNIKGASFEVIPW